MISIDIGIYLLISANNLHSKTMYSYPTCRYIYIWVISVHTDGAWLIGQYSILALLITWPKRDVNQNQCLRLKVIVVC